tara:strand:+ start:624 stop:782 length:159 start_codon:yes stop_codon:yes gene_type:complete
MFADANEIIRRGIFLDHIGSENHVRKSLKALKHSGILIPPARGYYGRLLAYS